jgi:LysR family nod box-dependent transcriptional activator
MNPNLSRVDLNLLLVLDALLTERGVTKASKRLFVSQPAVSGSLLKLREIFDDELLVRNGRQMDLTPRGRSLVEPVREVLINIQQILSLREDFDPTTARRSFRIAMSDYCLITIMPKLVKAITREANGIHLIAEPVSLESFERLESGDLDMCVMPNARRSLRKPEHPDMLRDYALYTDRFICVVAANHPVGATMTVDDYLYYPHARAYFGEEMRTVDGVALEELGISLAYTVQVPAFSLLLFQLPQTELIATVPAGVARSFDALIDVRILEPPIPLPAIDECLIWHARYDEDPGHRWLREMIIRESADFEHRM